jgi:dihydrofolate synthase/folylpolyglutamate synthase
VKRHSYVQAAKFILSREFFGMKLGLENIRDFLASIGSPQDKYPTIHIGGTNGKGSTSAMLASVLQLAGYKTGLYTSPHLVDFRERATVNGTLISRRSVAAFIDRHRSVIVKKNSLFSK